MARSGQERQAPALRARPSVSAIPLQYTNQDRRPGLTDYPEWTTVVGAAGERGTPLGGGGAVVGGPLKRGLTPRELTVLQAVAEFYTSRAVARAMGISVGTVRAHMDGVRTKLRVHTTLAAVMTGLREGLIILPFEQSEELWR